MNSIKTVEYLTMISNKNIYLNICMHLLVFAAIAALYLIKNVKSKKYIINGTILILCLSVLLNAVIGGNPFHIITFGIFLIVIIVALIRDKNQIDVPTNGIMTIISFVFIIMGLWYQEFVDVNVFMKFLKSPLGIVPCPTIITILGILNLCYPKVNKVQFATTIVLGIVYGFVGTFKLGVKYDLWLIGAVAFSMANMLLIHIKTEHMQKFKAKD